MQILARGMCARGHKAFVVGTGPQRREWTDQDVRISYQRASRLPILRVFVNIVNARRILRKMISNYSIDLLEATESNAAFIPFDVPIPKLIKLRGNHRFHTFYGCVRTRWSRAALEEWALRKPNAIGAISKFVLEETIRLSKLQPGITRVLPNAVDTALFCPRDSGLIESDLIVFVGTLYHIKGIDKLIDGMPLILKNRPGARLIVAGRAPKPGRGRFSQSELKARLEPEFRSRIEFIGFVPHDRLRDLFASAAVCVFPSAMETFGNVAIEAMACGRPVVFTRLGPGPEIIEDGISGLLCDPYDPSDIANKILRVLGDPDFAVRLGQHARKRVVESFSADVIIEKNIAFYEECIERFKAEKDARKRSPFRRWF
ncbi:MAG: glycosyltransferase family 4 protein [Candidatus Coatesbacteria bacterium]|nr:glycosyltransferase family 4 protein [Candidatus Coatesbacteria bacterium]